MLVMQGAAPTEVTLPELEVTVDELSTGAAKFDLQVILTDRGDHLDGQMNYASQLFDSDTMSGLADRFTMLLDAVAAHPDSVVGDVDLTAPGEAELVLERWNATEHALPITTLADLPAEQAARTPEKAALIFGERTLTYAEFDARVSDLARTLIGRGVGPDMRVAVSIRRSPELLVAVHAVIRAGAAYVPVDPDHPAERIAYVFDIAEPVCVLSRPQDHGALPRESRSSTSISIVRCPRRRRSPTLIGSDPPPGQCCLRDLHVRIDGSAERCCSIAPFDRQSPAVDAGHLPTSHVGRGVAQDSGDLRRLGVGTVLAPADRRAVGDRGTGGAPRSRIPVGVDREKGRHDGALRSVDARGIRRCRDCRAVREPASGVLQR
ncbi:hypothetical protein GCM10020255_081990 [Rhodococcus baikonurensis]